MKKNLRLLLLVLSYCMATGYPAAAENSYNKHATINTAHRRIANTASTVAPAGTSFVDAPTVQASNLVVTNVGTKSATLSWTNGNGAFRAVFRSDVNPVNTIIPVNGRTYGTTYVPGADDQNGGTTVGNSGWFCVYNGIGNTLQLNNLTPGFKVSFIVIEYNGTPGTEKYLATTTAGNLVSVTTISNDTDLNNISIDGVRLSVPFDRNNPEFYATVGGGVNSVTTRATPYDIRTSIKINGEPVAANTSSAPINVGTGNNIINILATAQDGVTTRSYKLNVYKLGTAAPSITYPVDSITFYKGVAITPIVPANTGGVVPNVPYGTTTDVPGGGGFGFTTRTSGTPMAIDNAGNIYVAEFNKVKKISPAGVVTIVAGSNTVGYANGTGTTAMFYELKGIAVDRAGNIFVSDRMNNRIRKITPEGVVSTFAGSGESAFANGTAQVAKFWEPMGMAIDADDNLYVADYRNQFIRKITPDAVVTTYAGNGVYDSVDGNALQASFASPAALTMDGHNNIYVAEKDGYQVRKISAAGIVTTVKANGPSFFSITADFEGNLYHSSIAGDVIQKIDVDGNKLPLAGGSSGNNRADGVGALAVFHDIYGLFADKLGNVYVGDDDQLRKVTTTGYSIVDGGFQTTLSYNKFDFNGGNGTISGTPSQEMSKQTYTVYAINTAGSSKAKIKIEVVKSPEDASLSDVTLSTGTLKNTYGPGFTPSESLYILNVAERVNSIKLTATAFAAGTIIKVNGIVVASGTESPALPLQTGNNVITVATSSPSGNFSNTYTFNVMRAAPGVEIFVGDLSIKYYGDEDFVYKLPNTTAPVTFTSSNTLVATIQNNKVHVIKPGNTDITATTSSPSSSVTKTLRVVKAPLQIIPADAGKPYGADNPVLTFTYQGFVNGESASVLLTQPSVTTTATKFSLPGEYPLVVSGATAVNYEIIQFTKKFNVYRAQQALTLPPFATKTYGDADFAVGGSSSASLPVTYVSSNPGVAVVQNGVVHILNAGETTIHATQNGNNLYEEADNVQQTLTVQQAPLTITSDDKTAIYGQVNPLYTFSYSGFVNGDTPAKLNGDISVTTSPGQFAAPGVYPIDIFNRYLSSNYSFILKAGKLTVVKAAQTISFAPLPAKTYGNANFAPGAVNSSPLPITYTTSDASVATIQNGLVHILKAGTVNITASQTGDANYLAAPSVTSSLTISPASLTITADNKVKKYSDPNPALSISYSGFVNGDNQSQLLSQPTVSTTTVSLSPVGNYPITASGATANNYSINYVAGTLTVEPSPAPGISSLSTTTGIAGTSVTLTGTYFLTATGVSFGGTPAASFVINSPTSITAVVGAGASGNVTVTSPTGTGSIGGFTYVFKLPANNFAFTVTNATCRGTNNGSVNIVASQSLSYTATVSGNGGNTAYPFTTNAVIGNLGAGTYNICVTVAGQPAYQQCYTINVTQPQDLAAYTAIVKGTNNLLLSLQGSTSYKINLNGQVFNTTKSQITLPLAKGTNSIAISTDVLCQGIITKSISYNEEALVYPNPFQTFININLGNENVKNASLALYDMNNKVVATSSYKNQSGVVQLQLGNLNYGLYVLKLLADNKETYFKLIKR